MAAEQATDYIGSAERLGNIAIGLWGALDMRRNNKEQMEIERQRAQYENAKLEQQNKLAAKAAAVNIAGMGDLWKGVSWLTAAVATSLVAIAVGKAMKEGKG